MSASKLAVGLQQTGNFETVKLLFEAFTDIAKLRQLLPDIPPDFFYRQYFNLRGTVTGAHTQPKSQ